jgi:1-acyl-sn-glycerol-3-phosphate acyltransferase
MEGRSGATYLAAKSGLPVIPVAALGTEDAVVKDRLTHFRRLHVRAAIGLPFTLPPLSAKNRGEQIQRGTDEIMCRIAALLPPDRRGVYANHPRLLELLKSEPDKIPIEILGQ